MVVAPRHHNQDDRCARIVALLEAKATFESLCVVDVGFEVGEAPPDRRRRSSRPRPGDRLAIGNSTSRRSVSGAASTRWRRSKTSQLARVP